MPKYAVSIPVVCVVCATIETPTDDENEVKDIAQELDFSLTLNSNSLENAIELMNYDTFADRPIIDGNFVYCELTEMEIEEIED